MAIRSPGTTVSTQPGRQRGSASGRGSPPPSARRDRPQGVPRLDHVDRRRGRRRPAAAARRQAAGRRGRLRPAPEQRSRRARATRARPPALRGPAAADGPGPRPDPPVAGPSGRPAGGAPRRPAPVAPDVPDDRQVRGSASPDSSRSPDPAGSDPRRPDGQAVGSAGDRGRGLRQMGSRRHRSGRQLDQPQRRSGHGTASRPRPGSSSRSGSGAMAISEPPGTGGPRGPGSDDARTSVRHGRHLTTNGCSCQRKIPNRCLPSLADRLSSFGKRVFALCGPRTGPAPVPRQEERRSWQRR